MLAKLKLGLYLHWGPLHSMIGPYHINIESVIRLNTIEYNVPVR